MEPTEPHDHQLRAFDALMREAFPARKPDADIKALSAALADLDHVLCELRDLVAQLRAGIAEQRHLRTKRDEYKPWI